MFLILYSRFLVGDTCFVAGRSCLLVCCSFMRTPLAKNHKRNSDVFRPEAGRFTPLEKAHSYRGELVFVDHANRRGSIRVQGTSVFRNDSHPFAMLPYGIVRFHGGSAGYPSRHSDARPGFFTAGSNNLSRAGFAGGQQDERREPQSWRWHLPRREPRPASRR